MTARILILGVVAVAVASAMFVRSRQRSGPAATRIDVSLLPCGPVGAAVWVLFSTPYCVPCRRVASLFAEADLSLLRVEVHDEPDLVAALDVRRSPTLVRVASDGAVLERHEGPDAVVVARRLAGQDATNAAIA